MNFEQENEEEANYIYYDNIQLDTRDLDIETCLLLYIKGLPTQ